MSANWREAPLSDLLTRRKDEIDVEDLEAYKRLTIRMNGRGIVLRDEPPGLEIGTKRQFTVRSGQLLLSKIDARNGAFGIVPQDCDGAIITGNFWAFDVDEERLDRRYLHFLTLTQIFVDFCVRASEGTTNRLYLQEDKFLAQQISIPPLSEQERIVARIESLAGKIEEARRLASFVGKESEALCRSMLFGQAEGRFPLVPMREIVQLKAPDVQVESDDTYDFAGVYCFGRGLFRGPQKSGTDFSYRLLTRLHAGNFVYPKLMAWEGALGVVPDNLDGLVVSTEFPVFEVRRDIVLPEILDIYFRTPSVWPSLSSASIGTNVRRRRLNPEDFLNLEIPLPPRASQVRIRDVRQRIDRVQAAQAVSAKEFEAVVPTILAKAFAGHM